MTTEIFKQKGLFIGRSFVLKDKYRKSNPSHTILFNANIATIEDGKIWWGDIDLTSDREVLTEIARDMGKDLYIVPELEGRFENEKLSGKALSLRAVDTIYCI